MKCAAALLLVGMHAAMAADVTLEWKIQAYDDMTATVGDTVTFDFVTGAHTVFMHPSGTCDTTGALKLATEGPFKYTFEKDDIGDIFFACEVSGHCDAGQIVKFTVSAAADGGDVAPSISPKPVTPAVPAPAPTSSDGGTGPSYPAPAPTTSEGGGGPSPPSPMAAAPASASGKKSMVLAHVLLLLGAGLLN